ncbi:nuclear transport factor 2 family protein [Microbacterium album]|uniref:SnoaL-like domain-containing protein n=1 Tax=Microbacterium album TaxID=2053191 RepID=A0A917IDK1_9MICO|nr:nuclear transport factor 2 family protein [Microbacterium album]GGH33539.1 hypothetical protein GCM10010921_00550 [Microbacterium album]
MSAVSASIDVETEQALFSLVKRERLARDQADWDVLLDSYWPDGEVRVTWFVGSPADFVEQSKHQLESGRGRGYHLINPVWAEVHGDRAIVESQGNIFIRTQVDGVPCDITVWTWWFSKAERRQGQWKLMTFDGIYFKDRLDVIDPDDSLTIDYSLLEGAREPYQHLHYLNRKNGYDGYLDLIAVDRPGQVDEFHAQARAWARGER